MKKLDAGQLISVLANIGVIGGIVFLGIELRQNNRLLESEARANAAAQTMDSWTTLAIEPEILAIQLKDRDGEELTRLEEMRLNSWWMRTISRWEWRYLEYPGDSSFWVGPSRAFETYGSLRRTWDGTGVSAVAGKDNFAPDFVEFIESEVAVK